MLPSSPSLASHLWWITGMCDYHRGQGTKVLQNHSGAVKGWGKFWFLCHRFTHFCRINPSPSLAPPQGAFNALRSGPFWHTLTSHLNSTLLLQQCWGTGVTEHTKNYRPLAPPKSIQTHKTSHAYPFLVSRFLGSMVSTLGYWDSTLERQLGSCSSPPTVGVNTELVCSLATKSRSEFMFFFY